MGDGEPHAPPRRGPRGHRAILFGLTVSAALIVTAPGPARAADREPTDPPSAPIVATTSTTVFPSAPPSPGAGHLAGTEAGEGRRHPGRADEPPPGGHRHVRQAPGGPRTGRGDGTGGPGGTDGSDDSTGEQDAAEESPQQTAPPAPSSHPPGAARAPVPARPARPAATGDTDRVMRVLPLGTGMTLTGLGLGFIALRLRRR